MKERREITCLELFCMLDIWLVSIYIEVRDVLEKDEEKVMCRVKSVKS